MGELGVSDSRVTVRRKNKRSALEAFDQSPIAFDFVLSFLYTLIWYIFSIFHDRFNDAISLRFVSIVVYFSFDLRCADFVNVMNVFFKDFCLIYRD